MRSLFLAACLVFLVAGCAGAPRRASISPAAPSDGSSWTPGPNAQAALKALWAAKPFGLDARTLAQASGGAVPKMNEHETLLLDSQVRLEGDSRRVEVRRNVWRILSDNPDQTMTLPWSPWHQERPRVRARVVSADGVETWVDSSTLVEGTLAMNGLEVSDVRLLRFPLPNARKGSVVELEVEQTDTQPLVKGAGFSSRWDLWSLSPLRRIRLSVQAPASAPLELFVNGVPPPPVVKEGSTQRVSIDVAELDFKPFGLTLSAFEEKRPSFGWSTASSWKDVAARYEPLVRDALADAPDLSQVAPLVAQAPGVREKTQVVVRWVSDHVRYTAVHLNEGAIVPTKPKAVLARGYGDCKDLAVLVASTLRRLGIPADVALTMADGATPREDLPGLEAFNHMIVAVPLENGSRLWVDATAPSYPVGVLPVVDRDGKALLVAANGPGLIDTVKRGETQGAIHEEIQLDVAPFGEGSATFSLTAEGAMEGAIRQRAGGCEATDAHKLAEASIDLIFGKDPFTARLKNCKPGEGPIAAVAQVPRASRLDTGDMEARLALPSKVLDWVVLDTLTGKAPGADQRTDAQKAEERKELLERTGYTEQQLEERPHNFDFKPLVERTYRIALPPRFGASTLPANRTIKMGPATWTETFSKPDPHTIEAQFRFQTEQVEWSIADVKAFREAYWKRFSETIPQVKALFEPARLLEDRHPAEAIALAKGWLARDPEDGVTRARYAHLLLELGLGDLAREEGDRALESRPNDPMVLMVRGDIARYSDAGLRYEPGWERAKAIECLAKAHELMPHHDWAVQTLADVLRRNEAGELQNAWTQDVARAAALLQKQVDANEATDEMVGELAGLYMNARRQEELEKLIAARPKLGGDNQVFAIIKEVLTSGVDGVLHRIERIPDPKQRLASLAFAYGTLVQLNRYDDAGKLVDRFTPGDALQQEMESFKAATAGLSPVPDVTDLSSPEKAAKSVFAQIANASSHSDASRRLRSLASQSGKNELDGSPHVFNFVRFPSMESVFPYVELFHKGRCVTTQGGVLARVRCEVPENRGLNATTYWSRKATGGYELMSLGKPGQLASRAWANAKAGRSDEAGALIQWLIDELAARQVQGGAATLLADYWGQAPHGDPKALLFAAALAEVTYTDMAREAPPAVVDTLRRAQSTLAGAMRRRAGLVLTEILELRGDFKGAAKVLQPIAASENEPWMWRRLASDEAHAGSPAGLARIRKALKRSPQDSDWRQVKATACLQAGRYQEAMDTLKALQSEQGTAVRVENNLLWAELMAGKVDASSEREAGQLAADKSVTESELHTAAMIMLERGRASEAAQFAAKRLQMLGEDDSPQLLVRGRLLQLLGFEEPAKAVFAKLGSEDRELNDLRKRFLAKGGKSLAVALNRRR